MSISDDKFLLHQNENNNNNEANNKKPIKDPGIEMGPFEPQSDELPLGHSDN